MWGNSYPAFRLVLTLHGPANIFRNLPSDSLTHFCTPLRNWQPYYFTGLAVRRGQFYLRVMHGDSYRRLAPDFLVVFIVSLSSRSSSSALHRRSSSLNITSFGSPGQPN